MIHTRTQWWTVPHCAGCAKHVTRYRSAAKMTEHGFKFGVVAGIITGLAAKSLGTGIIVLIACALGGAVLAAIIRSSADRLKSSACPWAGPAVDYQGWYGTMHEFVFSQPQYLQAFIAANRRKTMSDVRDVA